MEENWYDFVIAFASLCQLWDRLYLFSCLFIYIFIYFFKFIYLFIYFDCFVLFCRLCFCFCFLFIFFFNSIFLFCFVLFTISRYPGLPTMDFFTFIFLCMPQYGLRANRYIQKHASLISNTTHKVKAFFSEYKNYAVNFSKTTTTTAAVQQQQQQQQQFVSYSLQMRLLQLF